MNLEKIFPNKDIVNEIGYKTNSEVLKYYNNSDCCWKFRMGGTIRKNSYRASSRRCLPIISNIAGLTESKKIAYVLKDNNSNELLSESKNLLVQID